MSTFKTQKARGVHACTRFMGNYGLKGMSLDDTYILPKQTKKAKGGVKFPVFARPCPSIPRHGFVDSREINSWAEAFDLYAQAVEADGPDAELILTPQLSGKNSAVATSAGITWGEGNAGVTDGSKGIYDTKEIPSFGEEKTFQGDLLSPDNYLTSSFLNSNDVNNLITESCYVEIVEDGGQSTLVQLRDGPVPPKGGTKNIIVRDIVNPYFICPEKDLLAWEKTVLSYKDNPNTIVMAEGFAMSSHHVVHALQHGLSVITNRGSILLKKGVYKKTDYELPKLSPEDFLSINSYANREWRRGSIKKPWSRTSDAVRTTIATMHAQVAWDSSAHLLKLRGIMLPRLIRLGTAACMGELRHLHKSVRKTNIEKFIDLPEKNYYTLDRQKIYNHTLFYASLVECKDCMEPMLEDFSLGGQEVIGRNRYGERIYDEEESESRWRTGYGGKAWFNVAEALNILIASSENFSNNPNQETWNAAVDAANSFIHTSHNNGRVLDKWVNASEMYAFALNPVIGFMNQDAASVVLKV